MIPKKQKFFKATALHEGVQRADEANTDFFAQRPHPSFHGGGLVVRLAGDFKLGEETIEDASVALLIYIVYQGCGVCHKGQEEAGRVRFLLQTELASFFCHGHGGPDFPASTELCPP